MHGESGIPGFVVVVLFFALLLSCLFVLRKHFSVFHWLFQNLLRRSG